jgi:hypothetical protein
MLLAGLVARTKMRAAYKLLSVKAEGKRPYGTPTHRWEHRVALNVSQT